MISDLIKGNKNSFLFKGEVSIIENTIIFIGKASNNNFNYNLILIKLKEILKNKTELEQLKQANHEKDVKDKLNSLKNKYLKKFETIFKQDIVIILKCTKSENLK